MLNEWGKSLQAANEEGLAEERLRSYEFTLRSHAAKSPEGANALRDLKGLLCGPFSSRALAGILLTMVVSGGLRTYTGAEAPAVYHDPFIVAASTFAIAAIFLVYSLFLPHTSFRLGPLYRTAAPLFALGVAALTVFNGGSTDCF